MMFLVGLFILILALIILFMINAEESSSLDKKYFLYLVIFAFIYSIFDYSITLLYFSIFVMVLMMIGYTYEKYLQGKIDEKNYIESIRGECLDSHEEIREYKQFLKFLSFEKRQKNKSFKIISYNPYKCLVEQKHYASFNHFTDLKIQYDVHMRYYDSLDDGMVYVNDKDFDTIKLMDKFYKGKKD